MRKAVFSMGIVALMTVFLAWGAQASFINPADISGVGTYNNDINKIIDGSIPGEGTGWNTAPCVYWYGTSVAFTIDLGKLYFVQDLLLQVDNNDNYRIEYFTNNSTWSTLFNINSGYGEIGWGMDTMSSVLGHTEYIPGIDFAQVKARYLKFSATGGDNMYSISELQAFGVAAPLPGALWLLGSGMLGLVGLRRKL